jgi:hypothetical protein
MLRGFTVSLITHLDLVGSTWWLDEHASAVQAVCSVLGLMGLYWYCILTHGIHRAALRQASAATRPFIVIDELQEKDYPAYELRLKPISKEKTS